MICFRFCFIFSVVYNVFLKKNSIDIFIRLETRTLSSLCSLFHTFHREFEMRVGIGGSVREWFQHRWLLQHLMAGFCFRCFTCLFGESVGYCLRRHTISLGDVGWLISSYIRIVLIFPCSSRCSEFLSIELRSSNLIASSSPLKGSFHLQSYISLKMFGLFDQDDRI